MMAHLREYSTTRGHFTEWKVGPYTIRQNSKGSYIIIGGKIREKGMYVPSDSALRQRYEREVSENHLLSGGLNTFLGYRGLIATGKRSVTEGKRALELNDHLIKTKDGLEVGRTVTLREIEKAIDEEYPIERVGAYLRGEEARLPTSHEFSERYYREWRSMHRVWGERLTKIRGNGFERVLDYFRPGLYGKINASKQKGVEVEEEELARKLIERFNLGQSVNKTDLLQSADKEERRIGRNIMLVGGEKNWYSTIERVTKKQIKKRDVLRDQNARRVHGGLAEDLVQLMLVWKELTNTDLDGVLPRGLPHTKEEYVGFLYNNSGEESNGLADFRIGNTAIEVKTGMGRIGPSQLEDLIIKYTPHASTWETGEWVSSSAVFFLKPPSTYDGKVLSGLKEKGITVVPAAWFIDKIGEIINRIKADYKDNIRDVEPRPDFAHLVSLPTTVISRPEVLMRRANREMRQWSSDMLAAVINKGYELGE